MKCRSKRVYSSLTFKTLASKHVVFNGFNHTVVYWKRETAYCFAENWPWFYKLNRRTNSTSQLNWTSGIPGELNIRREYVREKNRQDFQCAKGTPLCHDEDTTALHICADRKCYVTNRPTSRANTRRYPCLAFLRKLPHSHTAPSHSLLHTRV